MVTKKKSSEPEEEPGITKSGVKKTIWLHHDEAETLRQRAFNDRRSEASIIREALRRYLRIAD
ncbi:MAG TPA: hypothetical protein VEK79_01260 [Thermoanaerobaculia bacterium]|nr:hypothetical protein [Thermoanaerobaculia bacterium]